MVTRKELKLKSKELRPMVNVGKAGLTDEVVKQVKIVLQRKKLLKIKFLRTYVDTEKDKTTRILAKELAEKTNGLLIDVVGLIVVLAKK